MRTRLRGRGRFAIVRAAGGHGAAGTLRVRAAENHLPIARAGFSLPGMKGSVERNRVRRRLRSALQPRLEESRGLDLVIRALPGAAELPYAALRADLDRCLDQVIEHRGGR